MKYSVMATRIDYASTASYRTAASVEGTMNTRGSSVWFTPEPVQYWQNTEPTRVRCDYCGRWGELQRQCEGCGVQHHKVY